MSDQLSSTLENQGVAKVSLEIPCLAEYVGVVRLAVLGVANRLSFNYDEVEDIRLAVGEACTNAIERATEYQNYLAQRDRGTTAVSNLKIQCTIEAPTLTIEVSDQVPMGDYSDASATTDEAGIDYNKLGTVLMEILVDQVTFETNSSGTTVRLVKSAGLAS